MFQLQFKNIRTVLRVCLKAVIHHNVGQTNPALWFLVSVIRVIVLHKLRQTRTEGLRISSSVSGARDQEVMVSFLLHEPAPYWLGRYQCVTDWAKNY